MSFAFFPVFPLCTSASSVVKGGLDFFLSLLKTGATLFDGALAAVIASITAGSRAEAYQ